MNTPDKGAVIVCALYRFTRFENYAEWREPLLEFLRENRIRGTLLLADEGINGTVAGPRESIDALKAFLGSRLGLSDIDYKESEADEQPFYRTKVKLKKEIVTMGVPGIDPLESAGTYVAPGDWNQLISDPSVVVIDTRNQYEVDIGTFEGALNPGTGSFREFPEFVEKNLDPEQHPRVAMFCTGGIRCEKSTAYLRERGFREVYHLQGGILRYLEEVPEEQSMWRGECFVFDNRVTVNHALLPGDYQLCGACRAPLSASDRRDSRFVRGVSCPHCHDHKTEQQRQRYAERERQLRLAEQRGEAHIGEDAQRAIQARRRRKHRERSATTTGK